MDIAIDELKRLSPILAALNLAMLAVSLVTGYLDGAMVLGLLLGNAYAAVHFILIGVAAKAVVKLTPQEAQRWMAASYFLRMMLTSVVIIVGFKAPFINALGVILPLFFPKISLNIGHIFLWKGGEKQWKDQK